MGVTIVERSVPVNRAGGGLTPSQLAYNVGRFLLRSPEMKKSVLLLMAVLILATASITVFGQGAAASEKLASGNFVVYAVSPQVWRFVVDAKTMANASVTGHFAITTG